MCGGGTTINQTVDQQVEEQNNAKLWNFYKSEYEPIITKYSERVTSPERQTEQRRQAAGEINAEVMKYVDPSKVSSNPVKNTQRMAELTSVASGAQTRGQGAVRSRQLSDVQNIIDIGRGKETEAQAGQANIAQQSIAAEIAGKQISLEEQAAIENAIGSTLGTAAGAGWSYARLKNPRQVSPPVDEFRW